jgi:hypothetical protein
MAAADPWADLRAHPLHPLHLPTLAPEERLMGGALYGAPWSNFPSHTRILADGCYVYQVDGLGFSEMIVFTTVQSH